MSSIDPLTGLLDRFGCMQTAAKLVADATISGNVFAVIWIDIDRFKQINESFGHLGGNMMIEDLALPKRQLFSQLQQLLHNFDRANGQRNAMHFLRLHACWLR